jgi:F5/8 type C domain
MDKMRARENLESAANSPARSEAPGPRRRVGSPGTIGLLVALAVSAAPAVGRAALQVNLAQGKFARQSSMMFGGDPSRAVDGNTNGNYGATPASVTHTDNNNHAWWEVDLGQVRQLGSVEIYNRTDCCMERLTPFMVIVSDFSLLDSDMTATDTSLYPGIMRTKVNAGIQTVYTVPINRSGRYVRIALQGQNWLSLAEVKVYEAFNAALGRPATQSSVLNGGDASRAVDGTVSGTFSGWSGGGVSATNVEYRPWWQADLGTVQSVREVHVWSSATDCCATANPRLGFYVWTSAQPITGDPLTTYQPGATAVWVAAQGWPAVVPINLDAQYVRIQLNGTDSLSLGEVQVWTVGRGSAGGHASMSSTAAGSSTANAAIDLSMATVPVSTQSQTDPYWDVDLGATRYLETVRLHAGPSSTFGNRAYYLFVSDTPFVDAGGTAVTTVNGMFSVPGISSFIGVGTTNTPMTTAIMRKGRYIRVMFQFYSAITDLREVEVITTQGFVFGHNNGLRSLSNPIGLNLASSGYVSRPGASIYAYAWRPNVGAGGGSYVYVSYATSGTTPYVIPGANGPLYWFYMPTFALPADTWPQGGVGGMFYETYEGETWTPVPLRSFDDNGSGENVFWPDIRSLSITPTPDDATVKPKYLDKPMGTWANQDYYTTTLNFPTTLAAFKTKYLPAGGPNPPSARFYNQNELGIGRVITCARTAISSMTNGTVCEIDNYGPTVAGGDPLFGDAFNSLAQLRTGTPISTVAMIVADGSSRPSFGAYSQSGSRTLIAPHDNASYNRRTPNNCMTCHGGSGTTNPGEFFNYVRTASMLPIDPFAVVYNPSPYGYADQVESIRKLNALILGTNVTPGVAEFINGTYPAGVNVVGSQPDPNFIPGGWRVTPAQQKVYKEVIKPHCRLCHLTQSAADGGLDFRKADDLEAMRGLILLDVCKSHRMPHAQQTLKNFWYSSARAQLLGYFSRHDLDTELCTP